VEDSEETVAQHFRVAIRRAREPVHPIDQLVLGGLAFLILAAILWN